jgi:hypothetical protein
VGSDAPRVLGSFRSLHHAGVSSAPRLPPEQAHFRRTQLTPILQLV